MHLHRGCNGLFKNKKMKNPHTSPKRKDMKGIKYLCCQSIKNKNTKCAIFKLTLIRSTKR